MCIRDSYSDALCARYFTLTRQGQTHFVLFDDARTLRRKLELARQLGIRDALVMLPEVEDLPDFFANKAGVLLEGGDGLFVGNARGHIRLNLAMPRATVQIGLERIAEAIRKEKAGA